MKTGGQHASCRAVLQPVQDVSHDAKAGWHQPRCISGMNALSENFNLEHAAGHASEAGGEPKLIVVAGTTVQANHQPHITHARFQRVDVRQQIRRPTFLTGFNQADNARMGQGL